MIFELLCNSFLNILNTILPVMPSFPSDVAHYVGLLFDYMTAGAAIAANYVNLEYLLTLFLSVLAVDVAMFALHGVIWVLKKIPLINIH